MLIAFILVQQWEQQQQDKELE